MARVALGTVGLGPSLGPVQLPVHDRDSEAASGVRMNAGTVSGNFSTVMPLTHSWRVAPQARASPMFQSTAIQENAR